MILYAKIFLLSIIVYLITLDIIYVIFNNISLGDIANVLATVILGVLGYKYTKMQDKKVDNQNKIERLTKHQSIITVDNELNSSIILDIATWHNYKITNQYQNVLVTDKNKIVNGMAYAFDLNIMFKCLSDTLPSKIRIREINMYDTQIGKKDENTDQLFLTFVSDEYEFKSLAFDDRKILPMTCLCCITNEEYIKLGKHDYTNKNMNFQIFFEVKNQFNVITELNLRAIFKMEYLLDVGTDNLGGQKAQFNLKLIKSYSNIINTYEEDN